MEEFIRVRNYSRRNGQCSIIFYDELSEIRNQKSDRNKSKHQAAVTSKLPEFHAKLSQYFPRKVLTFWGAPEQKWCSAPKYDLAT